MEKKRMEVRRPTKKLAKLKVVYLGKARNDARRFLNEGQCLELEGNRNSWGIFEGLW
jgi:hypothetical protein